MEKHKIYDHEDRRASLYVEVCNDLKILRMTLSSSLGYTEGSMNYLYEFLEKNDLESKDFNLQVNVDCGGTGIQESIVENAWQDFLLVFDETNFISVNLLDTYGMDERGNIARAIQERNMSL